MKSLKSIAQTKGFNINKLESLVETMDDLQPISMGKTLLYTADDAKDIINAYYTKYVNDES